MSLSCVKASIWKLIASYNALLWGVSTEFQPTMVGFMIFVNSSRFLDTFDPAWWNSLWDFYRSQSGFIVLLYFWRRNNNPF